MKSLLRKNLANFLSTLSQILLTKFLNVANFESHFPTVNTTLNETVLSEDEFEEEFKSLKRNKAPGHDGLDVNTITSVYELKKSHC